MGSGISLSEIQVTTIVKRDLGIDYQKIIDNRTGSHGSQWEKCKSYMEDEKYYITLREINNSLERVQSQRAKNYPQ
jgi:hypothetical protein